MSLYSKVHEQLKSGAWVMREILSKFEGKLLSELGTAQATSTIPELCLSYYSKTNTVETRLRSDSFGLQSLEIDDKSRQYILNILRKDSPEAEIVEFDTDDEKKIKEALRVISEQTNYEASNIVGAFQIFLKTKNVKFRSASHPHIFGVMLVGEAIKDFSVEQMAVSIVHELAHQELFLISLLDRLVNRAFDYHEIHAPFQGRKRPPIGRIHSLWALYRMVQFQKSLGKINLKHEDLMKQNIEAFEAGELTWLGEHLVRIVKNKAAA